jgi:hypothetical protein
VDDPKPRSRRPREREANRREHALLAQAWQPPSRSHRYVDRMPLRVLGSGHMRHAGAFAIRLAACPRALSSPSSEDELLLFHESAIYI